MKTSTYIEDKVNKLAKGYIFTYRDFVAKGNKREAIIKHLNRMVASGKISKLSKGKYYKAQETVFGSLIPEQQQIVKDLIEKEDKLLGYITGYSYFNTLGLTTQVSNIIQIGRNDTRPALKRGRFQIRFILQKNKITKDNISLLRILDSIRFIKKIPDTTPDVVCKQLLILLKALKKSEILSIQRLALNYAPSTRALLGALLEYNNQVDSVLLFSSLNQISKYKIGISENVLPTIIKWNIV
jgi:hypothetical protein